MNTRLNILEIQRTIQEKKQKRYETFEKIIEMCNRRIRDAADKERLRTFIIIPEFIVGSPMFNMNECLEFVITSFKKNGFFVRYYFPKMLYMSWDMDEIEAEKKPARQLPTMQIQKPKALLTSNIMTSRNGKMILNLD